MIIIADNFDMRVLKLISIPYGPASCPVETPKWKEGFQLKKLKPPSILLAIKSRGGVHKGAQKDKE